MNWEKKDIDAEIVRSMAQQYGCSPLVASILLRRGIAEGSEAFFYLENDLRYAHNPFLFANMEDAVDRILDAREEGEKVLIFGDRDVDGITAVTVLYEALSDLGIPVTWRIPTGDDPYGLSFEAIDAHDAENGTLIITVDCGISNVEEVAYAAEKGIDVIVIDHHTPQEKLPDAAVIINCKMPDSGYPHTHLSGCATAWKVVTAVRFGLLDIYKQQICLLNVRPVNDAFAVEAIHTVNLIETARITETIIPGMVPFSDTRLGAFLQGQQIFVWDRELQIKLLEKIFGKSVEFCVHDFRPECAKYAPQLAEMSLLRLKNLSRIGKYSDSPLSELDGFFNIFVTLVQQAHNFYSEREQRELQLVALSLLADMMQLTGENRILVKQGLASINAAPRIGLAELITKQGLIGKKIGTGDIAWNVTPVINATGRMGKPETAIKLFLEKDQAVRNELSAAVVAMNEQRKELGRSGWAIAEPIARESLSKYQQKLAVVVSDKIHRGITGILANQLANALNVPSMVICLMENGTAVGSLRSARNYRVLSLPEAYPDFFLDYGGHAFAAGFSMVQENVEPFLQKIQEYTAAIEFDEDSEYPAISIDAELPHNYLTPDLLTVLDTFEPYGEGFPQLKFAAKDMKIIAAAIMGKTQPQHLRLTLGCGAYKWTAIYWQAADKLNTEYAIGDRVDAVFTVSRNTYNGNTVPQMIIQDMVKTG